MASNGSAAPGLLSRVVEAVRGDGMIPERLQELAHQNELKEIELQQHSATISLQQEALAELELALEDTGWLRLSIAGAREFSVEGLRRLRRIARFSYLKNPLIRSATRTTANYVWGQGVSVSARHELVNDVVQAFLDDRRNSKEFTGHQARKLTDIELNVEGEIFLALFTNMSTGFVRVRKIVPDEIIDQVSNPEDQKEIWFHKRAWAQQTFDPDSGVTASDEQVAYYPDWTYNPRSKPKLIGTIPVRWDAPVYHVKAGCFSDMRRGVSEIYAALDWARAVKDDLENYSTIRTALSRFAWNLNVKGGKQGVSAAKTKLNTTLDPAASGTLDFNPPPVTGATFIGSDGANLAPIKTAGSAPSPDEGRRLWLMVSAGTGIPETILSGDAEVGNLATAKTLDRPTELMMEDRQTMWADVYADLLAYVVERAILAPNGPLPRGVETEDRYTGELKIIMPVDTATGEPLDIGVDVKFPSILQRDMGAQVKAVVDAATLGSTLGTSAGYIDDKTVTRLLYDALGETEIDERLAELYPDNGNQLQPAQDVSLVAALREVRDSVRQVAESKPPVEDDDQALYATEVLGLHG